MLRFSPSTAENLPEKALQRGIQQHSDTVFSLGLAATDDVHLLAMMYVGGEKRGETERLECRCLPLSYLSK